MDDYIRKQSFLSRLIIVAAFIISFLLIVLFNLFNIQVTNHSHYQTMSDDNRLDVEPVAAPRGLIYDRHGSLLAGNRTSYNLELSPAVIVDLENTLKQLQQLIEIDSASLKAFREKLESKQLFRNVTLLSNLSEQRVAKLAPELYHLPGTEIIGRLVRDYPSSDLFAHVVGHVGIISQRDLQSINPADYRASRYIGKVGIEKHYEQALRGRAGLRQIEVNARGKTLRNISVSAPRPGDDLMLSLDSYLQQKAYEALGEQQGAVVVLDTRSGAVLAMVSKPAFDPNLFTYKFSNSSYRQLQSDPFKPFFNRAISGQYPPGSTIKPVVALAALKASVVNYRSEIYAGPYYQLPGFDHQYRDWREDGHGFINLSRSITQSCDVFFYDTAYRMGIDTLSSAFSNFGLGQRTGIDTASEATGLVPSPQWKIETRKEAWLPAETILMGIGQSYLLATPLQLAVMTATLANRGKKLKPFLVRAIRPPNETTWQQQPQAKQTVLAGNSSKDWDYVIKAMINAVHSSNGTAYRIGIHSDYQIAGKTGTVQTRRKLDIGEENLEMRREMRDHAMFIGFAPAFKPEIAIAVIVEHSGNGSQFAAPVAKQVMDAYFVKYATHS